MRTIQGGISMKVFRTLSSALLVLLLLVFAAGAETAKTGDPAPEVKAAPSEAKAPAIRDRYGSGGGDGNPAEGREGNPGQA
jgi:hypothetical protein